MIELIIMLAALVIMLMHASNRLLTQNGEVADIALSTLAARTALLLDGDFTTFNRTFLAKRVRYYLLVTDLTAFEGPFTVGLSPGNASIPEITDAMTKRNTIGPSDVTQTLTEDAWKNVIQDSVESLQYADSSGFAQTSGKWHVLGGGKGIPFVESGGWTLNIFNADNAALTTGGICKGVYQVQGVWLDA